MNRPVLDSGTRIGPYILDVLIGQGGMGDVYRALQTGLDRHVALKLLSPGLGGQEAFVGRFLREARTMRNLQHPGIVTIHDAGEADGRLYLAMQLYPGTNLKQYQAQQPVEAVRALALLRQLADAIDYAHSRGIIHRDIKPANILLDEDDRPVLADFGLAKALDDTSRTLSGTYLGTPLYVAPEQASSRTTVGPPADLYSFACVAFEMLTGAAPYHEEDSLGLLLAHGSKPVPRATDRNRALAPPIDDVFVTALAKAPTDRYPSARTFVNALSAVTDGSAIPKLARRRSRRTVGGAFVGVLALAGALAAGVLLRPPQPAALPEASVTVVPTNSPSAAATPPPTAVGPAFFTARFSSAGDGFYDAVGRPSDPSAQNVHFDDTALVLQAVTANGDAGIELKTNIHTGYLVTMRYTVSPGSRVVFDLGLRWAVPGKLAYLLRADTSKETVALGILKNGQITPLAAPVAVPGLAEGRPVRATVRVDGPALTLWLDDGLVAAVKDTQVVETAGTVPGLDVYGDPGAGSVRIDELVYYNLPAS